jgi:transposase
MRNHSICTRPLQWVLPILSSIFVFPTVMLFFAIRIRNDRPSVSPCRTTRRKLRFRKVPFPVADVQHFDILWYIPIHRLKPPETFLQKLFGRTSEKHKEEEEGPGLFNEAESEASKTPESEETETITYTRAKGYMGRKPLSDSLPREEIEILPEGTTCLCCGEPLERLPESCDDIMEKLVYLPATVKVRREVRPKFVCKKCRGKNTETSKPVIHEVAATPSIMLGSIATPELRRDTRGCDISCKFQQGMPLYRLENYFEGKAKIRRQRMTNWVIGVAKALKPLDGLIVAEIRAGPVQRHDETRVQVVSSRDEEGWHGSMRQGWIWVALGGAGGRRAVRFKYSETCAHDTVVEYLLKWQTSVAEA